MGQNEKRENVELCAICHTPINILTFAAFKESFILKTLFQ